MGDDECKAVGAMSFFFGNPINLYYETYDVQVEV
jgi:hypothetical protein